MIKFAIVALLFLPMIFQFIIGNMANKGSIPLSFWQVSLISVFGQVLSTFCNFFLIGDLIRLAGSRDGLPVIGILVIEIIMGILLILLILTQRYIQYRRGKLVSDKNQR